MRVFEVPKMHFSRLRRLFMNFGKFIYAGFGATTAMDSTQLQDENVQNT
jgi:hypothetical protein